MTEKKKSQATTERDLRPVTGRHKDPPRADKRDMQGLLKEYMAHMREARHHQECAYFIMLDILCGLIGDK
mgnify:CR=1 FL=1